MSKNANLKKLSLIVRLSQSYEPLYDIQLWAVINRVKFDVCTPSSFAKVKTHRKNCALQYRLPGHADVARRASITIVEVNDIGSAGQADFTNRAIV